MSLNFKPISISLELYIIIIVIIIIYNSQYLSN